MKFMEDHHFDAQSIQTKQRDTEARFGRYACMYMYKCAYGDVV